MSVQREARNELSALLEEFLVRKIAYLEFIEQLRQLSTLTDEGDWIHWPEDRGASVILDALFLKDYGNEWEKWASGNSRTESDDTICLMRCLLFLRGDWEYEWDSRDYYFSGTFLSISDLLQEIPGVNKLFSWLLPSRLNRNYWPFCRLEDLTQAQNENGEYLPSLFDA